MTRPRLLLVLGLAFFLLLLGAGAGLWWYLFGANKIDAAELVPADTLLFATIPNGFAIVESYQSSQLKTLCDSPNAKPVYDMVVNLVGQKNADLIRAFAPNLSGQSFLAVTHFDSDHPEHTGLIAAMKPKAGSGDFDAFLEKLKSAWPDLLKQGTTGTGAVAGVDYQWLQGPGAADKICVAQVNGWIVTSWGEAALQDWVERFQKKSASPSLTQNADYQRSLARVGADPMTLVYLNGHSALEILQKQMAKSDPVSGDYLAGKLGALGGAALATRFENGEIVDRFSFLAPGPLRHDFGLGADPCPFETLKFTGPDTRFYWASNINWKQCYENLTAQPSPSSSTPNDTLRLVQTWARDAGLDVRRNIVDALGSEVSVQAEWSPDATYPEVGLFVKVDKPEDFKPAIAATIESVRQNYATSAVIREIDNNGQKFAALKFVQSIPISPTITEDGSYLGVFLTENQAVRSFQRDPTIGLAHNADFNRQAADKRNGAGQLAFLDAPRLLDRAYQTALPYLSIAGMFNRDLAKLLRGRDLPPNLTWIAPMGTWSCLVTPDGDGVQAYSVSGMGNQGILLAGAAVGAGTVMQTMGLLPKAHAAAALPPSTPAAPQSSIPGTPSSSTTPEGTTPAPSPAVPSDTSGTGNTSAPFSANSLPAPVPGATTNLPPASPNTDVTPPVTPLATNPALTNSNSNVIPPPPPPAQPQTTP